jgi:RHS repeat-associated protein
MRAANTTLTKRPANSTALLTKNGRVTFHTLKIRGNRSYSTTLGRFLQTDPIRFRAGDINLYRYVANNPVNLVDPLGLFWWAALDWGLTVADAKAAIDTWNDPCASAWDKGLAVGGTVAGGVLPGGGVVAGIRAGRAAAKTTGRELATSPWPANRGFIEGTVERKFLMPGETIHRYGFGGCKFVSPTGTPLEMRACVPEPSLSPTTIIES